MPVFALLDDNRIYNVINADTLEDAKQISTDDAIELSGELANIGIGFKWDGENWIDTLGPKE